MTADHAQPHPDHRPDQCHRKGKKPNRPGKAPKQELQPDALPVLDHEDDQQSKPDERGNHAAGEAASLPSWRNVGHVAGIRLDHESLLGAYVQHGKRELVTTTGTLRAVVGRR